MNTKPSIFLDSVPGYTPILIKTGNLRRGGVINILPIEELIEFKTKEKECIYLKKEIYIWLNISKYLKGSERWTRIKHIQRHYYNGKLCRVNCHTGLIDTSPNHSLFNSNGKEVNANNLKIGQKIWIKNNYRVFKYSSFIGNIRLAWLYGIFVAEGSVSKKRTSAIRIVNNKDKNIIKRVIDIVSKELHLSCKVYLDKDGCYQVSIYNKIINNKLRNWFYTKRGFKRVSKNILNAPREIQLAFLRGYYAGDGAVNKKANYQEFISCTTNSQLLAAGIIYLVSQTTKQRITLLEEGDNCYRLTFNSTKNQNKGEHLRKKSDVVKYIKEIKYKGYVYDIETDSHKFSGGIGSVILKNSGAYSIYSQIIQKGRGKQRKDFSFIKTKEFTKYLDSYIEFIHKYEKHLTVYANLDVIKDAKASFEVLEYMEKEGLKPLPVFHFGEDFKWLYKYIDKGYDYIGLGGMATKEQSNKQASAWVERVFIKTADLNIKYHGFAITKIESLINNPWHSVDSTSWLQAARIGKIMIPPDIFKKNSWDAKLTTITVSEQSINNDDYYKRFPKRYIIALIDYLKEMGLKYFNDEDRYSLKNLGVVRDSYIYRDEICAIFYKELENKLNKMDRNKVFNRVTLI